MSSLSGKLSNLTATTDPSQPDFEGNLAEFEQEFLKYVADTDSSFDFSLLRYNVTPVSPQSPPLLAEAMYPGRKTDLLQTLTLSGPQVINKSVWGNRVILEGDVRIKGDVYGAKSVSIGPNCVVEGSVVSGGNVQIEDGCRVEGTLVGQDIVTNGAVYIEGPAFSRSDFNVHGTIEAQAIEAVRSINLFGGEKDYVKVEASTIFAQNGDIDATVPVKLGLTGREADLELQRFYISRATDGTFRLARAPSPYQDGVRPAQGTIVTNLSDAELEKMLAKLADLERY